MNKLTLRFVFALDEKDSGEMQIAAHALLTVDDCRLIDTATDMLHLDELVGSIYGQGYFEIFTCGCGIAQCAYIWEDILVDQDGGHVLWTVPQPLAPFKDDQVSYKHFVFDREEYRQAIEDGLEEARKIARYHDGKISIGPHGFTVEDLFQLSTERPERVIDRRPGPREVFVEHGPVQLANGSIYRVVSEKRSDQWAGSWVEGWTGCMWSRDMIAAGGIPGVERTPVATAETLAEAGVPEDPFPDGYALPELGKNRNGWTR